MLVERPASAVSYEGLALATVEIADAVALGTGRGGRGRRGAAFAPVEFVLFRHTLRGVLAVLIGGVRGAT